MNGIFMSRYFAICGKLMLLMLCLASTGCASIFCGSSEKVNFTTTPSAAHVELLDVNDHNKVVATGTTPCDLIVYRGGGYFTPAQYKIRVSADGYPTKEVSLDAGLNGMYFGNLLIGGLVGMVIVDPLTGAMFSFPDVHVDMTQAATPVGSKPPP